MPNAENSHRDRRPALLGCNDRYFLLTVFAGRQDADSPCCSIAAAAPSSSSSRPRTVYLDLLAASTTKVRSSPLPV